MNMTIKTGCALLLALELISSAAQAADQGTKVNITATVVAPPPCVINDGRTIDIDFGKVGIKRIDGNRYMQRIDYSIKCEFLDNSRQLKMKIMGGARRRRRLYLPGARAGQLVPQRSRHRHLYLCAGIPVLAPGLVRRAADDCRRRHRLVTRVPRRALAAGYGRRFPARPGRLPVRAAGMESVR